MERLVQRRSILRAVGLAFPLSLLSHAAFADQPGEQGAPGTQPPAEQSPGAVDIFIGELERRIITDYYRRNLDEWLHSPEGRAYTSDKKKHKYKHLPPGLAKRSTLPPGLAKQLVRNGHLPPGLEYRSLPNDLIVQLPPLQAGYRYVMLDNRVMLIRAASNLILDVLEVAALEILD